ncbi:hypothetical protein C8R46DRAFT_1130010 [Mycena filopes]|nr:hypothetical protein C8R46DRAFT_1130010 [Mycena filopes]
MVPLTSRMLIYALLLCFCLVGLTTLTGSLVSRSRHSRTHSKSLCTDHPCVGIPAVLQIVNSHVNHISAIWDLVEGLGHPGLNFHPTAQRLDRATCQSCPVIHHDLKSERFLYRMHQFLWIADNLDQQLTYSLLPSAVHRFGIILKTLLQTQETLTEIELSQARDRAVPGSRLDLRAAETDSILNATVGQIVAKMNTVCETVLEESKRATPLALNASSLGAELALGLDGELVRVHNALNRLPWWDTWTLDHWMGMSRSYRHRAYLRFFEDEQQVLRLLVTEASYIYDNLADLNHYCLWYTTDENIHSVHTYNATKLVTTESLAQDIKAVTNRIRITGALGKDPEVLGWRPRRARSAHRIN